ncbi:polysaccharide biosynthesis/export family protein [Undibacterium arcticum]|uniref:Polysaccharide biosynthesis/export family protein n=1 Tax=Undibacterium arcticum TaxID=1762892 RepID=A0ABV7F4K6_9BURK
MKFLSCISLKQIGLLALIPWLVACASGGAGLRADPSASLESGLPANAPVVKQITPELVRSEREKHEKQTTQNLSNLVSAVTPYKIESGDILSIVVWDHPELAGAVMATPVASINGAEAVGPATPPAGFVVDHEGMVQFPYAGALKLAGLTEEQARGLLTGKLARYINKPKVTLRVQAYRSKRIYIDGEVKSPGLQAINDIPMTLVEALNRAGGLLPTADQSQIFINRAGTNYQINLLQLVQKGINPSSIMLINGDIVRAVSRDESKVFVSGEVVAPKALTMHNGRLTLNEALGETGGINPVTGDGRQVYVVRKQASEPVVYQLNASTPGALAMAESFELYPKDVVYVAASPLTNWHRAISLIFPSALSSVLGAAHP